MPITKLIVGGFKSIAQTIEIPLAPITLLFGPNSAGKSTIKDAMLALKASMTQPDDAEFRAGRLARMLLAFADRTGDGHILSEADEDGEALRQDDKFAYVAAWEFKGVDQFPQLHKESLVYEEVHMTQRSYK